jgi:hypothetical protein
VILVAGKVVEAHGDDLVTIQIILSDIGWARMRTTIDDASELSCEHRSGRRRVTYIMQCLCPERQCTVGVA